MTPKIPGARDNWYHHHVLDINDLTVEAFRGTATIAQLAVMKLILVGTNIGSRTQTLLSCNIGQTGTEFTAEACRVTKSNVFQVTCRIPRLLYREQHSMEIPTGLRWILTVESVDGV